MRGSARAMRERTYKDKVVLQIERHCDVKCEAVVGERLRGCLEARRRWGEARREGWLKPKRTTMDGAEESDYGGRNVLSGCWGRGRSSWLSSAETGEGRGT